MKNEIGTNVGNKCPPPLIWNILGSYHRGQNYHKKYFSKIIVLAQLILQKLQSYLFTKQSLFMFLANRDKPVAATETKKMFWWSYFCNHYKDYYKNHCSKE